MLRLLACGCLLGCLLGCGHARAPARPVHPPAEATEPSPTPPSSVDALYGTGGTPIPAPEGVAEGASAPAAATAGDLVVRPRVPSPEPGAVPRVEATEPVVGTTGKEVIRRVVRSHIAEVRACYNEALKKDPALTGRITIAFVIDPSGNVDDATATDVTGIAGSELPACIEAAIEQWVFPKPRGGGRVTVTYPFAFVPE